MSDIKHYDFFVIGAGSGGVRAARIAATHGVKVGLAEASALGGTCVNLGCVPKKIFSYGAHYGEGFADAQHYGWQIDAPEFDWPTLRDNKNKRIKKINSFFDKLIEDNNIDLYRGFARFDNANTLDIDGQKITADKILIATGGTPRRPSIPGGEHAITSDEVFFMDEFPKRATIIGGGYIAVEFAHILHGLGAKVDLLYRGEMFLRGFDDEIRTALAHEMKTQGISIHLNCDLESIEKAKDGSLVAISTDGQRMECDTVLAAIGRDAHTKSLSLEAAGVVAEANGTLSVDDQYTTNIDHIFAIGDIVNKFQLTPVAIQEGHVLADRLFGSMPDRAVNYENVATAIFSEPPIATLGLSEAEACEKFDKVAIYKSDFVPLKYSITAREEKSIMKLIVDQKTDRVLGVHMMGLDAAEIIQGFAVALNAGATKADFDRTMAVHPTSAEEFVLMSTPSKIC